MHSSPKKPIKQTQNINDRLGKMFTIHITLTYVKKTKFNWYILKILLALFMNQAAPHLANRKELQEAGQNARL